MDKPILKGPTNFYQNKKNPICLKVSIPYGIKYLKSLSPIYDSITEKTKEIAEDNLSYQAISVKLHCYSCNINFSDYHEMRKHQWTRTHQLNSGLITATSGGAYLLDDDNDDSDEVVACDGGNDDDEVEVDNNDTDEDSGDNGTEICTSIGDNDGVVGTDVMDNIDYIAALRSGRISFKEALSFHTVYFRDASSSGGVVGIKRCVLFNKRTRPANSLELMDCVDKLVECRKIAVLLYSGGCFAGAIFDGHNQLLHKTIKRYTYRRQQGGSQTTRDNQGQGHCKSGGAYLRRVNTAKLLDDVYQLLHRDWAAHIADCGLILVWSAKSQRYVFGHDGALNQAQRKKLAFDVSTDPRVRFISARVSRVNNTTLLDVYRQVATLEIYEQDQWQHQLQQLQLEGELNSRPAPTTANNEVRTDTKSVNGTKPKRKKEPKIPTETATKNQTDCEISGNSETGGVAVALVRAQSSSEDDLIRSKLLNYVLNDSADDLVPYLGELSLSRSSEEIGRLLSAPLKARRQSLLHLAVSHNNVAVIGHLLNFGCDPVHRNIEDETPYAQAIRQSNKAACAAMSDHMFRNPTQYDYHAAKFPGGKDPVREEQRRKQMAEKRNQYKKERKLRMKLAEEERKKELAEKCERDQFLALDNASKLSHLKQVERDQRKRFLLCFQCATDISTAVPFSYSDFSFCGMDCLKKHRIAHQK